MAVRSGVGFNVARIADTSHLFAELPSRVVLAVSEDHLDTVLARAGDADVSAAVLGRAQGDRVRIATGETGPALIDLDLAEVTTAWRDRLPNALGAGTTQA